MCPVRLSPFSLALQVRNRELRPFIWESAGDRRRTFFRAQQNRKIRRVHAVRSLPSRVREYSIGAGTSRRFSQSVVVRPGNPPGRFLQCHHKPTTFFLYSGNRAVRVAVCRTGQYDRADTGRGLTFWEFRRNNEMKTGVGQIRGGGGYAKALISRRCDVREKIKRSQRKNGGWRLLGRT